MGKFTKLLMVFVLLLAVTVTHAQTNAASKKQESSKTKEKSSAKTSKKKVVAADKKTSTSEMPTSDKAADNKAEKSKPATNDTSKVSGKDRQNQLQFMKPDMEEKNYNFYRRREISTPLQPRYDLDSAVYQKDKQKTKQQQAYINRQYAFPSKPKDQSPIGL